MNTVSDSRPVAVVIGELNSRSGPSVNGARLAAALRKAGHDIDLLHQTGSGDDEVEPSIAEIATPLPACHPLSPRLGMAFARLLRQRKWRAVIFLLPTHAAVLSPIARSAGAGTVFVMGTNWGYNGAWIRYALAIACRVSINYIVGVSQAIVDEMAGYSGSHVKSSVVYNGIPVPSSDDLSLSRGEVRMELGIPATSVVIGTCGRLDPWKRPIRVVEAARDLSGDGTDFCLVVVGDGAEREPMESYCREHGFYDRVRFVGWQRQVFRYLAAMDIFVFHSPDEGFPTVVAEAARIGLPMVLPDLPALHEIFADESDALYAPADDVAGFAAHIKRLCDDPGLRERLGDAARRRTEEHLSVSAMREGYERVIDVVTGS